MKRGRNKIIKIMKKMTFYNIIKGIRYLRHFGIKEFLVRLSERMEPEEVDYCAWRLERLPDEKELERQRKRIWQRPLKISILVPAYKTPRLFLKQMIDSVRGQTYPNWELCILNASPEDEDMKSLLDRYLKEDERVKVKLWGENKGISENTNAALQMASGDFVALLDHDDLLEANALYEIANALEEDPEIEAIYTDEDKVTTDLSEYFQPHLKPDFNLDLLRSNNYICHFFAVKTELAKRLGGFRPAYDGAQDYDFIFRCVREAKKTRHIAEILYHWRVHKASTADNPASKMYAFEAGKRAIEDDLRQRGEKGRVFLRKDLGFYGVDYELTENSLISIIIPNKDEKDSLETCIRSIEESSYKNYEIIIVENNSTSEEIFAYYETLKDKDYIKKVTYEGSFNYSKINNFGASHAKGDYLLFLNNDTKVIARDWMELMLSNCQRKDVGIVGAKLYYPDNTIQHAGTIIGMGGIAGHIFTNLKRERSGYLHKASIQLRYSAVTAACMMVKKSVFDRVQGFEEQLAVAFNDVDFCLRVGALGYGIVYHPGVELYHFESKSRGLEDSREKIERFQREIEFMRKRWKRLLKDGDPYYNKNLSLTKWNYSLRVDK